VQMDIYVSGELNKSEIGLCQLQRYVDLVHSLYI